MHTCLSNFTLLRRLIAFTVMLASIEVAAGTDLVRKLEFALLKGTSVKCLAWVDAHASDGFPAMRCLNDGDGTVRVACASIVHRTGQKIQNYFLDMIAQAAYECARAGTLTLDGFPNFAPVLEELRGTAEQRVIIDQEYKVSCLLDGSLVVKEAYMRQFAEHPDFRTFWMLTTSSIQS